VAKDQSRDAISSHVARLLKEARVKQNLSLKALSQKAGLARQTIAFIEQEVQSPSLDTLLRIAFALDVDLTGIIGSAYECARNENPRLSRGANERTGQGINTGKL
jgi:transcriptional regulator with XRE-family HTH domain